MDEGSKRPPCAIPVLVRLAAVMAPDHVHAAFNVMTPEGVATTSNCHYEDPCLRVSEMQLLVPREVVVVLLRAGVQLVS